MATIKKRTTKSGKTTYQVQVRRSGYPHISKNFPDEAQAQDWAVTMEARILNNEGEKPREIIKTTISELIDWYIANPDPKRQLKTVKHYNRLYFLQREFEGFTVKTLTPKILSKWIQKRLEINSPATVYHYYVALKNAMVHHSIQHSYSQQIFQIVKCPTQSGERDRVFADKEQGKLFRTIKKTCQIKQQELMLTIIFATETACRIGEMLQLKWGQVNLEERYVDFLKGTTKTKQFRRVPIKSIVKKILLILKKKHNPENDKNKRVFSFYNISSHHLSRQFKICCERAGIEDMRWHDLRHIGTTKLYSYISKDGLFLTDMEIATITGHKTLSMLTRYSHLRPSSILKKLN